MKKIVTYSVLFITFNCFAEDIEINSEEQNQYTKTTDDNNSVFSRLKHMFSKDGEDELEENKIVEVNNSSTQTETNNLKEQLSEIQNTQSEETQKTDNEFNRVAYRIAGLDNDTSDEYQKYSTPISQKWQTLCDSSLMKVRPWAKQNIDEYLQQVKRVLYVFGGPDIAYPCQFFPYANEYILVGLEPLGNFEKIKQLVDNNKLNVFSIAANSYLTKGYFITSEMGVQLSKTHNGSNGGLGIILLQLARMNYDIISIESLGINENGELINNDNNVLSVIKIDFKKDHKSDEMATVYYIRMDLSNSNASRLKMLTNFAKQQHFVTFVKSASYALQDRNFTTLKNFILNNTEALLQDDTGIAFRILKQWNLQIFGQYTGATLPIFKNYTQYDMIEYFKNHQAIGINFKIGYGFNQNRPALMLAIPPENRKIISENHMETNTKKISIKTQEVKKHNANNLNILKMIKIK